MPGVLVLLFGVTGLASSNTFEEARALNNENRYEEALKAVRGAIKREPENIDAQLLEGVILTRLGRMDDAIRQFQRIVRDHPDLPVPQNNLGVLYAAQGRYNEARSAFLKAIELDPRYGTALANIGDVYAKLAVLAYEQAYVLDPENRRAHARARFIKDAFRATDAPAPTAASGESKKTASPAVAATAKCFVVEGTLSSDALASMQRWLESHGARARIKTTSVRHMVYLPPFSTGKMAEEKISELRSHGISDMYHIKDGDLRDGIALGTYHRFQSVERRLAQLRALGYEAMSSPRYKDSASARLLVEFDGVAGVDTSKLFARKFSERSLVPAPCR